MSSHFPFAKRVHLRWYHVSRLENYRPQCSPILLLWLAPHGSLEQRMRAREKDKRATTHAKMGTLVVSSKLCTENPRGLTCGTYQTCLGCPLCTLK